MNDRWNLNWISGFHLFHVIQHCQLKSTHSLVTDATLSLCISDSILSLSFSHSNVYDSFHFSKWFVFSLQLSLFHVWCWNDEERKTCSLVHIIFSFLLLFLVNIIHEKSIYTNNCNIFFLYADEWIYSFKLDVLQFVYKCVTFALLSILKYKLFPSSSRCNLHLLGTSSSQNVLKF